MPDDYHALLQRRLAPHPVGRWDVHSKLQHFALVTYALPKARLEPYIPHQHFEIPEFSVDGRRLALMSAVPFVDVDFHFARLLPFLRFSFGQTNYRVYVINRKTGEHVVWFFGTTLGSPVVYAARSLWRIPWHYARYQIGCDYDPHARRYRAYRYAIRSAWGGAQIDLEDTGDPVSDLAGFGSLDEMLLILTHPVDGYYYRLDRQLGRYSVWHEPITLTVGRARHLHFSLYERLGLLSREEMARPHSVLICPVTEFKVFLPPKAVAQTD